MIAPVLMMLPWTIWEKDIFERMFWDENVWVAIRISLKFAIGVMGIKST